MTKKGRQFFRRTDSWHNTDGND